MTILANRSFSRLDRYFWLSLCAWAIFFLYLFCIPFAAATGGDFVHIWIGGHLVATGEVASLYDPELHKVILTEYQYPLEDYWGPRYEILGTFFYPPFTGLLYSPLGFLSPPVAQGVQAFINIGLGLVSAGLLTKILDHRLSFPAVVILLFSFPSFFYSFALGQNGILTMTIVLAGWYALTRGKPMYAGAWWSVLLYKPNWLLAVGWIPWVQRRWLMVLGMFTGSVILLCVTLALVGIAPLESYLAVSMKLLGLHNLPAYPLTSQYSVLSLFRRYLGINGTSDLIGWFAVSLIVGVTMWVNWRQASLVGKSNLQGDNFILTFALALAAAVCLNPHLHHYDMLLMCVAGIVALAEWASLNRTGRLFLITLFVFHHLAFLAVDLLGLYVPLPTLAMLAIWGWLLVRVGISSALNEAAKAQSR